MPDASPPDPGRTSRSAAERAADHAAIERLTDGLLPALIAKLGATGLGELEVREGAWRVRLRRPGGPATRDRRASDRATDRPSERGHASSPRQAHAVSHATVRSESRSVATSPA